jgi:hypothetical protein
MALPVSLWSPPSRTCDGLRRVVTGAPFFRNADAYWVCDGCDGCDGSFLLNLREDTGEAVHRLGVRARSHKIPGANTRHTRRNPSKPSVHRALGCDHLSVASRRAPVSTNASRHAAALAGVPAATPGTIATASATTTADTTATASAATTAPTSAAATATSRPPTRLVRPRPSCPRSRRCKKTNARPRLPGRPVTWCAADKHADLPVPSALGSHFSKKSHMGNLDARLR